MTMHKPLVNMLRSALVLVALSCVTVWANEPVLKPSTEFLTAEFNLACQEYEEALAAQATQPDRAQRLFASSAQRFQSLIAAGVRNGFLEYNLANAKFQQGELGHAILHYRRADRLLRNNALVHDNLDVARRKRLNQFEPTTSSVLMRTLFSWHYNTASSLRTSMAFIGYGLFFIMLSIFFSIPGRPRMFLLLAALGGIMAITCGTSLFVENWQEQSRPEGVVLQSDVIVRKGPGVGYQKQFEQPLQMGVEFHRVERRSSWWNIRLPDGNEGWIDAASAALIVPRDEAS